MNTDQRRSVDYGYLSISILAGTDYPIMVTDSPYHPIRATDQRLSDDLLLMIHSLTLVINPLILSYSQYFLNWI